MGAQTKQLEMQSKKERDRRKEKELPRKDKADERVVVERGEEGLEARWTSGRGRSGARRRRQAGPCTGICEREMEGEVSDRRDEQDEDEDRRDAPSQKPPSFRASATSSAPSHPPRRRRTLGVEVAAEGVAPVLGRGEELLCPDEVLRPGCSGRRVVRRADCAAAVGIDEPRADAAGDDVRVAEA